MKNKKPRIGLVLSGGGARGFAHIGVLKVLEENNIKIDAISGISMGAIVGALYSSGKSPNDIEKIILNIRLRDIFKLIEPSFSKKGFVKGEKLMGYIMKYLPAKDFKDLKIPLVISATDIMNEKEIVFKKGDLATALIATSCVPGVFEPKHIKSSYFVDGGIINPLGLGLLKRHKIDFSIVVNVTTAFGKNLNWNRPNILDVLKQSTNIMQDELIRLRLNSTKEKIVLILPKVEKYDLWDIRHHKKIIEFGEKAAKRNIKKIRKYIEELS
ncbi:MAG: patatin-like phospholipase family protein [Nanoarchaeota archaeon]|nr:patatin-like phospholipase family protein [Nanoarchaeota archaeon]